MSDMITYLSSRKQKRVLQLLEEHSGRCKAVSNTLTKVIDNWILGKSEELKINKEKIHAEEKSADNIEYELIFEVSKSEIPNDKMKEDLIQFVRLVDSCAGSAKRAATNITLLGNHVLPEKYASMIKESGEIIAEIFDQIVTAIAHIQEPDKVEDLSRVVGSLENKMDHIYSKLKSGYFEMEEALKSAAALLILDHITRDLEECTDKAEDSLELLAELVRRRR